MLKYLILGILVLIAVIVIILRISAGGGLNIKSQEVYSSDVIDDDLDDPYRENDWLDNSYNDNDYLEDDYNENNVVEIDDTMF